MDTEEKPKNTADAVAVEVRPTLEVIRDLVREKHRLRTELADVEAMIAVYIEQLRAGES